MMFVCILFYGFICFYYKVIIIIMYYSIICLCVFFISELIVELKVLEVRYIVM